MREDLKKVSSGMFNGLTIGKPKESNQKSVNFNLVKWSLAVAEKLKGTEYKLMTRHEIEISKNFYRVKVKFINRASGTAIKLLFLLHPCHKQQEKLMRKQMIGQSQTTNQCIYHILILSHYEVVKIAKITLATHEETEVQKVIEHFVLGTEIQSSDSAQ